MSNETTEPQVLANVLVTGDVRKLVTIRKIASIDPIEGADAIVCATIDGWKVVVKKDEFVPGDECVFFEIDAFLPDTDARWNFLPNKKTDEKGVVRSRLKTVKLRGQISQGLALKLNMFPEIITLAQDLSDEERYDVGFEQFLNVTKYESPAERSANGGAGSANAAGDFPHYVPKTDANRLQNVYGKYSTNFADVEFRPTLKLDGSSTTVIFVNDEKYYPEKLDNVSMAWNEELQEMVEVSRTPYPFRDENGAVLLCSRNLMLKHSTDSAFWKSVHNSQVHVNLRAYCEKYNRQLAVQGETLGPAIQSNREAFNDYEFYAFHIWDIDKQEYVDDAEFYEICEMMQINTAPAFPIEKIFQKYDSLQDFLTASEIKSINHPIAEGIVYKSVTKVNGQTVMFKVINNKYLLSEK